ncbi:MAG: inositol-3-phosphate synthase [Candidatus Lokiarchaeota archaeon]|nr:inositol-3-phosphate synthase [Candidatus Lokiarchaeota archaeon]MBD3339757.1 inositol-3-phosphate synthase [Candidatus Lokiarchaeota archaeon]
MTKNKEIKVALAGVGNVAAALVMGIEYYKNIKEEDLYEAGLMNASIGGYLPSDIKIVAGFDVSTTKINKPISEAIYAPPNLCQPIISQEDMPKCNAVCYPAPILDGCYKTHNHEGSIMYNTYEYFRAYDEKEIEPVNVAQILKETNTEILINLLPVGSYEASRFYAQAALDAGCAFINGIPEFIISERLEGDKDWVGEFEKKGLPCAGDDIKSQIGATILHRMLAKLFLDRGVIIRDTYQLNIGGNGDFYNMKSETRLKTKRKSKTSAVTSVLPYGNEVNCRIGPSDYVPFLEDKKICYIRVDGITFGGLPLVCDLKLRVEDSPNSAGLMIDLIRETRIALDRGIAGRLESISSFSFKHPHIQPPSDLEAKKWVDEYIEGKRER